MESSKILEIPSKSAVRKAGEVLRSTTPDFGDYSEAIDVLSKWRSLHSYPINTYQAYLRTKVKRDEYSSAIIAQRLKRMPSIITKLQRFPTMQLDRVQDIGGIRVVLERIHDVYRLYRSILNSKIPHQMELPPKDYIKEPKSDGYRSLHQVFKYANKKHPELDGLRIELQLRTKLQHSWATAVETLGIVEKSSFKTGEGSEQFKRFFKLSSALFSFAENTYLIQEYHDISRDSLVAELKDLESELQVFSKLEGLAISANHIQTASKTSDGYHVMELDIGEERILLTPFPKNQPDKAESYYRAREQATKSNPSISVVLISAGNVSEIKKAYPNYFLDTNMFIRQLKKICDK